MFRIFGNLNPFSVRRPHAERQGKHVRNLGAESLEVRALMTNIIPFAPTPGTNNTTFAEITRPDLYVLKGTLLAPSNPAYQSEKFDLSFVDAPGALSSGTKASISFDSSTAAGATAVLNVEGPDTITSMSNNEGPIVTYADGILTFDIGNFNRAPLPYEINVKVAAPTPSPPVITLDTATVVGSTVKFTYDTTGNPGPFKISLYESANPTLNSSSSLVTSQQENPAANSSGADTFKTSFIPNPSKPYLLVVVSPGIYTVGNNDLQSYIVSVSQLQAIMGALPLADAEQYIAPLNEAIEEFQINTPKREAAFLAQIAVESTNPATGVPLTLFYEAPPSGTKNPVTYFDNKYNGSNGNVIGTNDGYNFRGHGPIQLTGRTNFVAAQKYFNFPVSIVTDPDSVAENLAIGFRTAAWFYAVQSTPLTKTLFKVAGLNSLADTLSFTGAASLSNPNFVKQTTALNNDITRVINGPGLNGLKQRLNYYQKSLEVLS